MQPFELIVWLTVGGKMSLVLSVVTGPDSFSFPQTMTSSLVTQVPLFCNTCSLTVLLAALVSLKKQVPNNFVDIRQT